MSLDPYKVMAGGGMPYGLTSSEALHLLDPCSPPQSVNHIPDGSDLSVEIPSFLLGCCEEWPHRPPKAVQDP